METFKEFINEKFHVYIKGGYTNDIIAIYLNPNLAELNECAINATIVRGLLDTSTGNLYIWNAGEGLHEDVYENKKIIQNRDQIITLEFFLNPKTNLIETIIVTSSVGKMWNQNPKVKEILLTSQYLRPLISPQALERPDLVMYYDGRNWDKMRKL